MKGFSDFFCKATGNKPYRYQVDLANRNVLPTILNIPTGCGKTEAAILGWLWRRKYSNKKEHTPRRLIYCLPMRTIVDQTVKRVNAWIENLGIKNDINVTVLMGGNTEKDWTNEPEKDAIIIGTQDMLLSRALNRGYGISPYRWPMEFGLINNDCLWVVDEVQLMNNGLPTSLQLQAFRKIIGTYGPSHTMWMSATIDEKDLTTIDFHDHDKFEEKNPNTTITAAKKPLKPLNITPDKDSYKNDDVRKILSLHKNKPTLIIINKVKRAQALYKSIKKEIPNTEVLLIHSRFRPYDRNKLNERLKEIKITDNVIVVSTQAIEAGVDISSHVLITELAPITSMIQRFGRCNRKGEYDDACVYWIKPDIENDSNPYTREELEKSKKLIAKYESASPLDITNTSEDKLHQTVLRKVDLEGLFDTAPDLSGSYLDVSRFVRSSEAETDVSLYWRVGVEKGKITKDMSKHNHDELCKVPLGDFKKFAKSRDVWYYDYIAEEYFDKAPWIKANDADIRPGRVFLIDSNNGGYSEAYGWSNDETSHVKPIPNTEQNKGDLYAYGSKMISLSKHSTSTKKAATDILNWIGFINSEIRNAVIEAALYHDLGKSHPVFQKTLIGGDKSLKDRVWAKSPGKGHHERKNFRHEVGSALVYLEHHNPGKNTDLTAYLIATHHGKVRMTMRSMLNRTRRIQDHDYLLGFSTNSKNPDRLPKTYLGDTFVPETKIDMTIAEIGEGTDGSKSWIGRTTALRDDEKFGVFRIAYLEAILRAADIKASKEDEKT